MTSVLVVDDRETDRELVATALGTADYTVLQAPTGEVGIEVASAQRPDLIMADIPMPTMDGYEFVRELRRNPLAGISRWSSALRPMPWTSGQLAEACGVSHILIKPCEPKEIVRVVREALELHARAGGAPRQRGVPT